MNKQHVVLSLLLFIVLFIIAAATHHFFRNKKQEAIAAASSETDMRKKILILTSFGGGGTLAGSQALQTYLQDTYNIESKYVFKELLEPLDPFGFLTFGRYSSEEVYNIFVPAKLFTLLGCVYYLGSWYIHLQKNAIYALLYDYCAKTKPDLLISVVPIINYILLQVAQDLNIPFLLMPTDLDVAPYIMKIDKPTYEKLYVGLVFDDPDIMAPVVAASIPQEAIVTLGAPLREAFFTKKNKSVLRSHYHFDRNKFTIMILMGSHGSRDTEKYVAELLKLKEPAHLIVCVGKNEESKKNISQLSVPGHITLSVVGFTPDIVDYMTMSDLLISKSGTLSVDEALYTELPLFLDATSRVLPWEKFNLKFVKKHEFGDCIQYYKQLVPLVTECIKNRSKLKNYKNNIRRLEKKNFPDEIRTLIDEIMK